jgi:hypothetical protein
MPLIATRGAASAQGFGEFAKSGPVNYIEDVFSTYLYTGNGTSQTITTGLDISTYGGLNWIKKRNTSDNHTLSDTARGIGPSVYKQLITNSTNPESDGNQAYGVTALSTTGFSITGSNNQVNGSGSTYVSWNFRKQAKFFDIVTYTGNGTSGRTVAHSLGSVPGCIIVKKTSGAQGWGVYHTSLGNTQYMFLNTTGAAATSVDYWNNTTPTSTQFTVGAGAVVNQSGQTYVAYLFAHDAGGFGTAGTDNVISCGSFTSNGSGQATVNLGYEPQWILMRPTNQAADWDMFDTMRGITTNGVDAYLTANTSNAESNGTDFVDVTATGFNLITGYNSSPYIYIAIRRGPMKTPTSGTSVFSANTSSSVTGTVLTTGFPIDLALEAYRAGTGTKTLAVDRLRGFQSPDDRYLNTRGTDAEASGSGSAALGWDNTSFQIPAFFNSISTIYWNFGRAPSFMDVVCYTGTGSNTTQTHNLGAVPEMMIVKRRDTTSSWVVYHKDLGNTSVLILNTTAANNNSAPTIWNSTTPTSTVFSIGTSTNTNASGGTYVAYLFASTSGVSKVGSYSGTGATQTISCGFAARFVMIKRTDSTGDWWVWDTARGMVSGTDPRLGLNLTNAETNADWVYTDASGFQIVTTDATVNASGGSYIYFCVA